MKKHPENDPLRLRHMLEAAQKTQQFIVGKSRTDLADDEMLMLALVRLLEIIGEAATHVSDETRTAHPEIPWPDIAGMRNRVIHGYFDIELDIVWDTITLNIPLLIEQLRLFSD